MSSLTDRPNTALLVIDMQKGVLAQAHDVDRVVGNINTLVDKARAEGVPVVWVQHSDEELPEGSDEWEYIPELQSAEDEPWVHKHYNDSFEDTDLDSVLEGMKVGRVVVTGAQTDACVRATLHGAFVRGYDTTLVGDAHTTGPSSLGRDGQSRAGHRLHEPLLELVESARTHRGHGLHRGGGVLGAQAPGLVSQRPIRLPSESRK